MSVASSNEYSLFYQKSANSTPMMPRSVSSSGKVDVSVFDVSYIVSNPGTEEENSSNELSETKEDLGSQ